MDLCVKDSNLNISTRHTMWIYAIVQTKYTPTQTESNHVNTCVEVEHGRNHLITGH
jgi:hypothetical protein